MNYKKEIQKILIKKGFTYLKAYDLSQFPEIWELDVGQTKEEIVKYFQKNPDYLEIYLDDIVEDYTKNDWNVNVWRNS